jgi:hypothetical protein
MDSGQYTATRSWNGSGLAGITTALNVTQNVLIEADGITNFYAPEAAN